MAIELRGATGDDRPYLLRLRELTMVEHLERAGIHLSREEHELGVDDAYDCAHVITVSGEDVGALKYRELTDRIEVMQLQAHPRFQGQGLGRRVMEKVLSWSKSKQKPVVLAVLKSNPARSLYERLGFVTTGEDENE